VGQIMYSGSNYVCNSMRCHLSYPYWIFSNCQYKKNP